MSGLTEEAGQDFTSHEAAQEKTRRGWQTSMERQLGELRAKIRATPPEVIAYRCGGRYADTCISLRYWGQQVKILWPQLEVRSTQEDALVATFDSAMLIYYLSLADGTPRAGRWIGFRELPNGGFYHQAFQGYSGNRLAGAFGQDSDSFHIAAQRLDGDRLLGLGDHAYAFQPLPHIHLAAVLWPGDEDFPAQASILFDAASSHYMTTDGLALLGSGLTGRLLKKKPSVKPP